jgi:hypothetical protein
MEIVIGGHYRHYKGGEYTVLGIGWHTETKEQLVVYQAHYDSEEFGPRAIWARPLKMFTDTVEMGGATVPRFEHIDQVVL